VYCSAVFDHVRDSLVPVQTRVAPASSVLILDGLFLHRPELRDTRDFSIFLHAPFDITIPRGAVRGPGWEGSPDPAAPSKRRYVEGSGYTCARSAAGPGNVVIGYSDLTAPIAIAWRWRELTAPRKKTINHFQTACTSALAHRRSFLSVPNGAAYWGTPAIKARLRMRALGESHGD
jgi:hypothetical protein